MHRSSQWNHGPGDYACGEMTGNLVRIINGELSAGIDVASSSAYQAPGILVKHKVYEMAEYDEDTCEKRMGRPEELGFAIATIADERNGYLCGIDILIDGGASTGKKFKKN